MFSRISRFGLILGAVLVTGAAQAENGPPSRLRGVIAAVDGTTVTIKTREGDTATLKLADNFGVAAVVKATLADIKPGAYVGAAAMTQKDGSQKAIEVAILPERARGSNEGHYAWDLLPESTMTNATVAGVVSGESGSAITLTYKDGKQTITVPPDVPVVTFAPGEASEVKPGTPVFVFAEKQPDGTFRAGRITVGRNGVAPPM